MKHVAAVRCIRGAAASLVLLLAAVPRPGTAQEPRSLVVGDRVRVEATTPSGQRFGPKVAVYQGTTADTLWLSLRHRARTGLFEDSVIALHPRWVQRLEVSVGHRHPKKGAIIGASVAAALGALYMIAWNQYCTYCEPADDVVEVAALFGAGGAGIGALVGWAISGTGPWIPAQTPGATAHSATRKAP